MLPEVKNHCWTGKSFDDLRAQHLTKYQFCQMKTASNRCWLRKWPEIHWESLWSRDWENYFKTMKPRIKLFSRHKAQCTFQWRFLTHRFVGTNSWSFDNLRRTSHLGWIQCFQNGTPKLLPKKLNTYVKMGLL